MRIVSFALALVAFLFILANMDNRLPLWPGLILLAMATLLLAWPFAL